MNIDTKRKRLKKYNKSSSAWGTVPCHVIQSDLLTGRVSDEKWFLSWLSQNEQTAAVPVGRGSTQDLRKRKLALGDSKNGLKK